MIVYIESGDIFKLDNVYNYAHGCNCAGAMGKGIAAQFKEKFPKMYSKYKRLCKEGTFTLGDVFEYNYDQGTVFNLGTQDSWRTKANINAIEKAITTMLKLANKKNIDKIALPQIGAGLGGLNWDTVKATIEKAAKDYTDIKLFIVENYKAD